MPVYDEEKQRDYSPEAIKQKEQNAHRMDDEGTEALSPGEQAALDQIEAGYGETAKEPDRSKASTAKNGGDDQPDNQGDNKIPFSKEPERRGLRARFLNRKAGTALVISIAVGGGGFGMFSVLQGPLEIIHLSNIISGTFFARNNNTGDISSRRLYNTVTEQGEKNRLTALASALTTRNLERLSQVGIEVSFTDPDGKHRRKLQSISVDPRTEAGKNLLGRAMAEGYTPPRPGANNRVVIGGSALQGREGGRLTRALSSQMVEIDGKRGISAVIAKRRLKKLFRADFTPMSVTRRIGESLADYKHRRRAERAQQAKTGTQTKAVGVATEGADADGKTQPIDADASSEGNAAKNAIADIQSETDPIEKKSKLSSVTSNSAFKAGATAAAVVAVTCAVKDVGDEIPKYKMLNVMQPLIRLTVQYIAAGSQTQAQGQLADNIDMAELEGMSEALYDEETGTSWASAAPILAIDGQSEGNDIDPAVRSQIIDTFNEDKPGFFNAIDGIPFIGTLCGVNSWVSSLPVIKQAGDITGGLVSALSELGTGKSTDEWMMELVAVLSGEAIDVLAAGAKLGNLLTYGGLMTANATSVANGGTELEVEDLGEWNQRNREIKLADMKKKSWQERTFSLRDPDSFASTVMIKTAGIINIGSLSRLAQTGSSSLVSSLKNSASNIFTNTTMAQPVRGYDFGMPEFGIPLSVLESERYDNIYENLDRMEDNDFAGLRVANAKWGGCFGNPLDAQGNIVDTLADEETYKDIEKCKGITDEVELQNLHDYQIYIQDNVTIKSLACFEGIDAASCSEIGMDGSTITSGTNSGASGAHIPDCSANNGNAAIACVAIDQLMGIPYSMARRAAPDDPNPEFLDCSALINMAIFRAFGNNLGGMCSADFKSHPDFQPIDVKDIQPGDIVGRGDACVSGGGRGHVGIVVSYDSATGALVTAETDRRSEPSRIVTTKGLLVDGKGTYEWAVRYTGLQIPNSGSQQ